MHGPRSEECPKIPRTLLLEEQWRGKVPHAGASSPRQGHHALLVNLPYMTPKKAEKSWPRCWTYKVNLTITMPLIKDGAFYFHSTLLGKTC